MGETIDPPRNFSISLSDRVRAYAGPPAYMRRRRAIEDLEVSLLERLRLGLAEEDAEVRRDLAKLNDLIDRHNRYYPMEANLPIDPPTGRLLERNMPWRPLAPWTFERLVHAATIAR
jgi:hypothetical protein